MRRFWLLLLIVLAVPLPPAAATGDPMSDRQWGLSTVRAPEAWKTTGGAGSVVAIVDTGVHLTHEDLKANVVAGSNVVSGGPPSDDHGHGTHVAGIAAAAAGNGIGVAGVAPKAKIMPVKALRFDPESGGASGTSSDIAEAIRWAADSGADVINLSIGSEVAVVNLLPDAMHSAIRYAWGKGAIPVLAAGNDALFPSGYSDVDAIVVGATNRADRRASYSSDIGIAKWGMVAPGGERDDGILSTYWQKTNPDAYAFAAGTSMAAPHVAGAAALLRSLGIGQRETVDILLDTAVDVGSSFTYGAGRLDARAAVVAVSGKAGEPTKPSAPSPTPAAKASETAQNPAQGVPRGVTPSPATGDGEALADDAEPFTVVEPAAQPTDGGPEAAAQTPNGATPGPVAVAVVIVAVVAAGLGGTWLLLRVRRRS